jgi:hypothetical protein
MCIRVSMRSRADSRFLHFAVAGAWAAVGMTTAGISDQIKAKVASDKDPTKIKVKGKPTGVSDPYEPDRIVLKGKG